MVSEKKLQCAISPELSWFDKIKELLKKYNLPSPSQLLKNVPTKNRWKNWLRVLSTVWSKPSGGMTLRRSLL